MSDFRRRLLTNNGSIKFIEISKAVVGDIAFYDKNINKIIIVKNNIVNNTINKNRYIPIGIVVVPTSHNRYNDNSCSIMSLNTMNLNTPNTGGDKGLNDNSNSINWGYNNDFFSITNLETLPQVGSNGTVREDPYSTTNNGILSSDLFNAETSYGVINKYDNKTYYSQYYDYDYLPSPYKNDDSSNDAYITNYISGYVANAFSDFNGLNNTDIIIKQATAQTDWKTDDTIYNNTDIGYYPAACCCWRYYTEGTKQGDWYLPACGEIGYIIVRAKTIITSMNNLKNIYGDFIMPLNNSSTFYSSTEPNANEAWYGTIYDGKIQTSGKDRSMQVRAFYRIK